MIYIIGGSGKFGRTLMRYIDGVYVSRSGSFNTKKVDYNSDEFRKMLSNADVVINTAGRVFGTREELIDANALLVKRIVSYISSETYLIHISSISIYGKKPLSKPIVESTKPNPDSDYALSKLIGEKEALKHKNTVILRPGPMYNPFFADYFKVFKYMRRGIVPIIGGGRNRIPFTYADDVALLISTLINERPTGIYNVAGVPERQIDIYRIAAKYLKCDVPKVRIPVFVAKMFVKLRLLKGITEEHINILSSDRPISSQKAIDELGFKQTPIEVGIKKMVDAYNKQI